MAVSSLLAIGFVVTLNELKLLVGDHWAGLLIGALTPVVAVAACVATFVALQRTISSYV